MKTLTIFLTITILSFTSCAKEPYCEKSDMHLSFYTINPDGSLKFFRDYTRMCEMTPKEQEDYRGCSRPKCFCQWER